LYDYLTEKENMDIPCLLLDLALNSLPRPSAKIRVFHSVSAMLDAPEGIVSGAAVFSSVEQATWLNDGVPSGAHRLLDAYVYPDELVTFSNPHHFIYVPRSA
jgi:hypothetical protein